MRHLLSLAALLLPLALPAAPVTDRGQEIAMAADNRLHGYTDMQVRLEMVLVSPTGETASRVLRVQSRESANGGEKTLMAFETPRDLAGTALLTWTQPQGNDEQWLYLPSIKRVKQIGARNKSGPFMGSEFAFEDIVTPYWQKFSYRFLREDMLDGVACLVVERTPRDTWSGYTRQIMWVSQQDSLIRRIDYFDRKNAPLKTYTATKFRQYGTNWRPSEMLMVNQQTGKQTRLLWSDYRFGTGLKDEQFSQNALQRVK
jgi:outer membrane lipoprotein-sorting protein